MALASSFFPIDRFDKTLFPENLTLEERNRKFSDISGARVGQLELSMVSPSSMEWKELTGNGRNVLQPIVTKHPIVGCYITSDFRVDMPAYHPNLLVDTGRDDTWMQWKGCTTCFPLRQGNFNRSKSRSYRPLTCEHPLCVPRMCINGSCAYNISYHNYEEGRNSYSKGQVASADFYFYGGRGTVMRSNTVFSCGLDNYMLRWRRLGENNTISIMTQYARHTKIRISYCLPSWHSRGGTHTLLNFGDDARIRGRRGPILQTTALISNVTYMVNFTSISINRRRLNISPAAFAGGLRFDSGSPYSFLAHIAYDAVNEEITQYFVTKYSWHPKPSRPGYYDICYDVPRGNYTYRTITYHFSGANLSLAAENVFRFYENGFCLMIMPTRTEGHVLGAFQQANHRFLFDFERLRASFVPEVCEVH